MQFLRSLVLSAFVALGLFSAPAMASESFDINSLFTATVSDLQTADADAKAHSDTFASQCYEAVIPVVESQQANLNGIHVAAPVGVVSAFQEGRDGVKLALTIDANVKVNGLLPPAVVQGCGPLALDVQNDLGKANGSFALTLFGGKIF